MDRTNCLQNYFVFNKVFLSGCGIWPYQNVIFAKLFRYFWITQQMLIMVAKEYTTSMFSLIRHCKVLINSIFDKADCTFIIVSFFYNFMRYFYNHTIKLYEIKNEIDLIIEAVASFFYNIIITIKFINGVVNECKIKSILATMQNDWHKLSDASEIEILSSYANLGKLLNLLYICTVYNALLLYMFLPLTPIILDLIIPLNESRPKEPLIMAEFFIDQEKYFYSLMIHAYFTAFYGVIPLLGTDTFYMNCVHHTCGMITILRYRIKNALNNKKISNSSGGKVEYNQMSNCIAQQQNIIEFCDGINETYSTSFLIVSLLSMTLMSFTGVATVIKLNDIGHFNDVIRFGMFTNAQIFHLFCYNYMGQNVLNIEEKLRDFIYNSYWYQTSTKTQGLVRFMMLRSLRPITLRARVFPLCLPNFTRVMKTSMSYFTVLQSTR